MPTPIHLDDDLRHLPKLIRLAVAEVRAGRIGGETFESALKLAETIADAYDAERYAQQQQAALAERGTMPLH